MNLPDQLEAAIVAAPDDPAPVLVAADYLLARGDPLGEFISLSRALEHESNPAIFISRKRQRDELLRVHAEQWLNGAFLEEGRWRWGLVTHARVQVEHLDAFLSSSVGRYVRELEVQGPLESLAASFSRVHLPLLTGLALKGRGRGPAVSLASVTATLPQLRRLGVFGVDLDFTHTWLNSLTDVRVRDVRHPSLTPFVANLGGPALTHLELLLELSLELKVLVTNRTPALRWLHLEDDLADELAAWAAKAPIMKQLEGLGLSGPMTDQGLDCLLLESARLHRLDLLLEGGHFSGATRRLAYRQLPKVAFHRTRAPLPWWSPT
jgi:uncharacterized protein (TIGR02996 family)